MLSSSSPSPDDRDGLLRRFLVASRRGEIVAQINSARSEEDLASVVATELCEAYEAEIGFVLMTRPGSTTAELVGCVGLIGDDPATVLAAPSCSEVMSRAVTTSERGTDLLGLGIRTLALAPGTAGGARLLVGVGRLYDQPFDALESALLETVAKSAGQAFERFDLERQLQRAHDIEAVVARPGNDVSRAFYGTLATIIGRCDLGIESLHRGTSVVETELREIRAAAESAAELVQRLAFSRQQIPKPVAQDVNAVDSQISADAPLPWLPHLGSLADLFRLLGHPLRLRILLAVDHDTLSPSELEQRLDVGLGVMAYHVGVLRDDGYLTLVDTRPSRGALESFYRLTGRGELARNLLEATCEMSDFAKHP